MYHEVDYLAMSFKDFLQNRKNFYNFVIVK